MTHEEFREKLLDIIDTYAFSREIYANEDYADDIALNAIQSLLVEMIEGQKKAITPICFCDCIPCKVEGNCKGCNLGEALSDSRWKNGDLCNEGDNSDYVLPYNKALNDLISLVKPDEGKEQIVRDIEKGKRG
jgi:hypothetical protein